MLANERQVASELETALESSVRTVDALNNEIDELTCELEQTEAALSEALARADELQAALRTRDAGAKEALQGRVVPTVSAGVSSRPHALS